MKEERTNQQALYEAVVNYVFIMKVLLGASILLLAAFADITTSSLSSLLLFYFFIMVADSILYFRATKRIRKATIIEFFVLLIGSYIINFW